MRFLGVDVGLKRTGLALSDDEGRMAFPKGAVESDGLRDVVRQVTAFIKEHEVGTVIVGLPLDMSGREGPAARRARRFAEALEAAAHVQVAFWDERLTTQQVTRTLREAKVRGKRIKAQVDESAAAIILQGYLDQRSERDVRWE